MAGSNVVNGWFLCYKLVVVPQVHLDASSWVVFLRLLDQAASDNNCVTGPVNIYTIYTI